MNTTKISPYKGMKLLLFTLVLLSTKANAQIIPLGMFHNSNAAIDDAQANAQTVTDITVNGRDYRVHTFTASSDFTVTDDIDVEYLIVAGGGGGGGGWQGGGGGAGGMLEGTTSFSPQTYRIVVGSGGVGAIGSNILVNQRQSSNGKDSSISVLGTSLFTATGGGRGASESPIHAAGSGGSGGGGTHSSNARGTGTPGQGFDGGEGISTKSHWGGGGGGGAGAIGQNAVFSRNFHPGGVGFSSAISGSSITYSTGGDGVRRWGIYNGADGHPNSGDGGGGGCSGNPPISRGGAGGSGIVIIRYLR